ncbi:Glutaredoxin 3 (Grx3) [hydrothermal vent metagenome]|uniref:Glutaredoxin 3 (Grx3) n=1 Tax=hydrothermal vent metagenome TaxID=652676 RepID=A0A1W1CEA1_9ZZZZ
MKNIVYATDSCPYCQNAFRLLTKRNIPYQKIIVDSQSMWDEVMEKSGRNTVPQIFINGTHIGGFDDLVDADMSGKLEEILK